MKTKTRLFLQILFIAFICQFAACGGGISNTNATVTGIPSATAVSAVSAN